MSFHAETGCTLHGYLHAVTRSNLTAPKPAREWLAVRTRDDRKLHIAAQLRAQQEAFHKRSLADQEAALNLAQFAQLNTDLNLSSDQVQNLIITLIVRLLPTCDLTEDYVIANTLVFATQAEAPNDVASMCNYEGTALTDTATAKDPPIPPSPPESDQQAEQHAISEREKQTLLMFQELIRRRLEAGSTTTA